MCLWYKKMKTLTLVPQPAQESAAIMSLRPVAQMKLKTFTDDMVSCGDDGDQEIDEDGDGEIDFNEFNHCVAALAVMAYVIADMEIDLPK